MYSQHEQECQWNRDPRAESNMDSLHAILNCASAQGCRTCVPCSERALDLFLKTARAHAAQEMVA